MGFRFQRRIKIMPGVTLNVGKHGVSTSIGRRGAHITFGQNGVRTTVGIPGTGISYTSLSKPSHAPEAGSREASWPHLSKCPYCGHGMRKRWDRCPACHQVLEQPLPEDAVIVDDRTPETALTEKERTTRVQLALLSLEPSDREVFLPFYYYCQRIGDIAREMGLNESTVKSRLRRGREKLKTFLLREVPYDEVSEKGGTVWNTISTS